MSKAKIAITLEEEILEKIDCLIGLHVFPNRSRAIQEAMEEKLERLEKIALRRNALSWIPLLSGRLPRKACPRIWRHGPNIERRDPVG